MERLDPRWRKATYSANGGADCVETGSIPGAVLIRDTKNREHGPVLRLTESELSNLFTTACKACAKSFAREQKTFGSSRRQVA